MKQDSLAQLCVRNSAMRNLLDNYGAFTLEDYLSKVDTENNTLLYTADHLGILHHDFFWGVHAAASKTHTVYATSNVSLFNSSLPHHLSWHTQEGQRNSVAHFTRKQQHSALYAQPKINDEMWHNLFSRSPLSAQMQQKVWSGIDRGAWKSAVWLPQQLCMMSESLFAVVTGKKIIYKELEQEINSMLTHMLTDEKSAVFRLFSSPDLLQMYFEYFSEVQGAHSRISSRGSFLFWHFSERTRKRVSLHYDPRTPKVLTSKSGFKLELESAKIVKMLERRELMPTLALSYCLLACEQNKTLAGGFSQIEYLPRMIASWNRIFPESFTPKGSVFGGEVALRYQQLPYNLTLVDFATLSSTLATRLKIMKEITHTTTLSDSLENAAPALLKITEGTK